MSSRFIIQKKEIDGISLFSITTDSTVRIGSGDFIGLLFDELTGLEKAVAMWRYKPWDSWTKPMALFKASQMPDGDVQFLYWKNRDGTYGAAVPLSGNGYRTTLGSANGKWGSKSMTLSDQRVEGAIPALAVGSGKDPFELFRRIYAVALTFMGKAGDLIGNKTFPEPFHYLGWCTWNSSDMGRDLNESQVLAGVKTFTDHHFPLGWVLIDDGWFRQHNNQLQSMLPDSQKFPHGFKGMNERLKGGFGIRYMGIWHALNGYWNGIDPSSGLGRHYQSELFSWKQENTAGTDSAKGPETFYFIKPGSDSLQAFYDHWYGYFKDQGFDFTKVDNQLVTERMALNNYPVFELSQKIHQALYRSSQTYFKGALINCMDMTPEAYLNFGASAVARSVEDYFPYKSGETYNLQAGNAAAHVLQAVYNALYFSQMVYPDFDMFQSHNPNARFHAIARVLNDGPVYLTDIPGRQDFSILDAMVYRDGRLVHSEAPLLPTEDCLFQVQDKQVFKAWSRVGKAGLLGVWNAADTDQVEGGFMPSDVHNLGGDAFVVYEYFSKHLTVAKKGDLFHLKLKRMDCQLYYIIPLRNGFAPVGLTNKYIAPATVLKYTFAKKRIVVVLYEGGPFMAFTKKKPKFIKAGGQIITGWSFDRNILTIDVPFAGDQHPEIEMFF